MLEQYWLYGLASISACFLRLGCHNIDEGLSLALEFPFRKGSPTPDLSEWELWNSLRTSNCNWWNFLARFLAESWSVFVQVSSTYLFHELPHESREKAIVEMARVVRPGGVVIFNDGLQMGDRPIGDAVRGSFQAFNEPNWGTHITLDYGTHPNIFSNPMSLTIQELCSVFWPGSYRGV